MTSVGICAVYLVEHCRTSQALQNVRLITEFGVDEVRRGERGNDFQRSFSVHEHDASTGGVLPGAAAGGSLGRVVLRRARGRRALRQRERRRRPMHRRGSGHGCRAL